MISTTAVNKGRHPLRQLLCVRPDSHIGSALFHPLLVVLAAVLLHVDAAVAAPAYNIRLDLSGTNKSDAKIQLHLGDAPDADKLTEQERAIPVYINILPPNTNNWPTQSVLRIANFVYSFIKERGYGLGGRELTNAATCASLVNEFSANYLQRIGTNGTLVCHPGTGFIRLANFQFNPPVEVHIPNLRAQETTLPSDKPAKFAAMVKGEETKAARLLLGDQVTKEYPILPDLSEPAVARALHPDKRLRLDPSPPPWLKDKRVRLDQSLYLDTNGTEVIPLQESGRWLRLKIDAGVSYSTADNFTGNGAVAIKNALGRQMNDWTDPYDTLEISGSAGPQLQSFTGQWGTPFFRPENQLQAQVNAGGGLIHNDRTAFPGPPPTTFGTRVWSGGANASTTFDSFSLKDAMEKQADLPLRKRFQYITAFTAGLKYTNSTIFGQAVSPTPDQGRTTTLDGRMGLTLLFDLHQPEKAGIGEVEIDASLSGEVAPSSLSDHFNYTKWQAAVEATFWFGWKDSRDFFLRQNLRNGSLFGTTPALSLFRLGGNESVRGLQEGELAGRSVLSTTTELGYGLARLGQRIFGNPTNSAAGTPLDDSYLKGFFDYGRTSQNGSISSPWHEGSGAVSYGAAVEISKPDGVQLPTSLSLGYAYSPQSKLHRGGMVFVSAGFAF